MDAAEWDEWADDDSVSTPSEAPRHEPADKTPIRGSAVPDGVPAHAKEAENDATQGHSPRAVLDWTWDLDEIDADLRTLAPADSWSIGDGSGEEVLSRLATLAQPTRSQLHVRGASLKALRAQANVTQWSLRQLQRSLQSDEEVVGEDDELASLQEALQVVAGDWATDPRFDAGPQSDQQLHEMSSLLQHALSACDAGDVLPFQQAIEQLFSSLPDLSLTIPTSWIRPPTPVSGDPAEAASSPFNAYLQALVSLCGAHESSAVGHLQELTDAQKFQDTKDIQRDELVVNGEAIVGSIGYDAIIAKIEAHIYAAVASVSPMNSHDAALAHVVTAVAKQTLNACNRTESGGCSYEILSQFVSQHSMEHVLIRPASARAPPLEISFDLGPYKTPHYTWSFGLRARVSAVTWYCICDANDPTNEFYEVETTYTNRLAFPLNLSPLSAKTLMRRDDGHVTITLKLPPTETITEAWVPEASAHSRDEATEDVDFDSLM